MFYVPYMYKTTFFVPYWLKGKFAEQERTDKLFLKKKRVL